MSNNNPYDELYKQIDFSQNPFGYSMDYLLWRTAKLKRELAKFITADGKILDVGGGMGIMTQFLPDFINKKKNYYNLDVSMEMLRYSPNQNVLAASEHLPFPVKTFDFVISSDVLEHVKDKMKTLTECYRVLKPEGLFLLSTPRAGWVKDYLRSPFLPFIAVEGIINRLFPRSPRFRVPEGVKDEPSDEAWLRETLENLGFKVLQQYRADNHVPWRKAGESKFWRWFADRFVDPQKYGHCTIVICKK
jgi:ubiquinone/menaquinone biosynthesis C-methylase UbiE